MFAEILCVVRYEPKRESIANRKILIRGNEERAESGIRQHSHYTTSKSDSMYLDRLIKKYEMYQVGIFLGWDAGRFENSSILFNNFSSLFINYPKLLYINHN